MKIDTEERRQKDSTTALYSYFCALDFFQPFLQQMILAQQGLFSTLSIHVAPLMTNL